MQLISRLDPLRHKVFQNDETELGRWLGRECPDHRTLFVYFHCQTGNYVLAQWVSSDQQSFTDVLNIGQDCSAGWDKATVQRRLNPQDARLWLEDVADEEYRDARTATDESFLNSERRNYQKRPMVLVP